jgi:hypothetical protein
MKSNKVFQFFCGTEKSCGTSIFSGEKMSGAERSGASICSG